MRKLVLVAIVCTVCLAGSAAVGQQIDASLGFSGVTSPSLSTATASHSPAKIGSGTWMAVSGNVLLKKHFGFGGEAAWRAKQNLYPQSFQGQFLGFQPYRPIFYDFNGVYGEQFGKYAGADLMAGFGGVDTRFYTPNYTCGITGCTNYTSSNHLMGHFGGRFKIYPTKGSIFIAPEAHLYLIRNNFEFSSGTVTRFGLSIGYTFRPGQ